MELFKAHNQWKTRPLDERFKSTLEMHKACGEYRQIARESCVKPSQIRVTASGDELLLEGRAGVPATLCHWSMGQLSQRAGAPAGYLRELPATLAAQNINHGLKELSDQSNDDISLLFHQNGSLVLRAATSEKYERVWNNEITQLILMLQQMNPNLTNPLAYKIIEPGKKGEWPKFSTEMEPAGLYASDHDMFAFLVDEKSNIDGSGAGLNRGFFMWNSEVGAKSFGIMSFLYDRVCGNNIVWGAKGVKKICFRHTGNARDSFVKLSNAAKYFLQQDNKETEKMIVGASSFVLGESRQEVIDVLFTKIDRNMPEKTKEVAKMIRPLKGPELTQKIVEQALDVSEKRTDRYGNPYTLWGVVSGLTEASQFSGYNDQRTKIDEAAGELLKVIEF